MAFNEAAFDEEQVEMMEVIPASTYKHGMSMVPPVSNMNKAFKDVVEAVKRVQALDIPMPKDRNGIMERLNTENNINTYVLSAMERMNDIVDVLNDIADKAEEKETKVPQ